MPWLDWNHTPEFDPKIDVPRTTINNFAGPKQPPWRDGLPSSCGALLAHMLLRFSNRNIDESSIYRGISIVGMCGLGPFPPSRSRKFPTAQLPHGATSTFHDFSQLFPTWNHHSLVPPEVCQYLLHHSMARRQLTPSVVTLAQLVEAYGHGTRWAEALQSLQVGMGGLGISQRSWSKLKHWNNMKQHETTTWLYRSFFWLEVVEEKGTIARANHIFDHQEISGGSFEPIRGKNGLNLDQLIIRSQGAHRFSLQPDVVLVNATAKAAVRGHGQHLANVMEITWNKHK